MKDIATLNYPGMPVNDAPFFVSVQGADSISLPGDSVTTLQLGGGYAGVPVISPAGGYVGVQTVNATGLPTSASSWLSANKGTVYLGAAALALMALLKGGKR